VDSVRRGWQLACAGVLGVFGIALVLSLGYPQRDALGPGPGFFPFWLSVIGLALAATMLVQAVRAKVPAGGGGEPSSGEVALGPRAALKAVAVVVATVLAAALLEQLGFRLTILVFIGVLLPVLGARSVLAVALCAALGSFGVFHVFYHWLKVPLPIGAFGM
jgi:putative tricarboxylic transport membrane protein